MSGEICFTLPFRYREVQKDCQNRKREIGYMPLENCPFLKTAMHTFNHCFPCGCGFNPKKKREKAVNVSLFTVGHVFVGFVHVERVGIFFCFSFFKIIEY